MGHRTRHAQKHPLRMVFSAVMVMLVLTSCVDDDEPDSTPTADVATVEREVVGTPADDEADSVEVATPTAMEEIASSPANGVVDITDSSPDADETAESGSASPTPEIVVSAPPVTVPTEPPEAVASPEDPAVATPVEDGASGIAGDGTGGPPLSVPDQDAGADASVDEGAEDTTDDVAVADSVVDSCSVDSFPAFTGDASMQVTTADVNFRTGPGTDCELIFDQPLGEGAEVEVISDPVTREGEPEFTWVAIALDGTVGWVVAEFVEPTA